MTATDMVEITATTSNAAVAVVAAATVHDDASNQSPIDALHKTLISEKQRSIDEDLFVNFAHLDLVCSIRAADLQYIINEEAACSAAANHSLNYWVGRVTHFGLDGRSNLFVLLDSGNRYRGPAGNHNLSYWGWARDQVRFGGNKNLFVLTDSGNLYRVARKP